MAMDRFVRWKKERPSRDQIGFVVEDYFRGIATSLLWDNDRWFVTLPGKTGWALARIYPDSSRAHPDCWGSERWIEVWPNPDGKSVDVMTRNGDDVTHALADGLVALLALTWDGKVESG